MGACWCDELESMLGAGHTGRPPLPAGLAHGPRRQSSWGRGAGVTGDGAVLRIWGA